MRTIRTGIGFILGLTYGEKFEDKVINGFVLALIFFIGLAVIIE